MTEKEIRFGQVVITHVGEQILVSQHKDDPRQFEATSKSKEKSLTFPGTMVRQQIQEITEEILTEEELLEGFTKFGGREYAECMLKGFNRDFK